MTFRKMRRLRQLLPETESVELLRRMTSGVLALEGDGGYPYAVPLSYVYHEGKLYFHSALQGHKIDAVRRNAKASFCVVAQDEVVAEEFTTYFRSVIAFGRIRIIDDDGEKKAALRLLGGKYSPADWEGCEREIAKDFSRVCILGLTVEHLSGKEAIELVRNR